MKTRIHEILRVAQPAFLINSEHKACRYETADGQPLQAGYYFALWPARAKTRHYGREVRYFGPFAGKDEALLLEVCAEHLGLIAPTSVGWFGAADSLSPAVRAAYASLLKLVTRQAPRCSP